MSVIRVNKTKDYSVMSNYHLKDKKLSLKAKGLLSVMLSLPDDWDYSISGLTTLSKDGKDSIMNVLKELENFGYLIRTKLTDKQGKFAGYDYDIFENPNPTPYTENQVTEKPYSEKPNTENPTQLNTNILNTKKQNTNISNNISKRFSKPTLEEVSNYIKEFDYHFSAEDFINHYESVGWKVGKSAMKDWKACCRTWESNWKKKNQPEVKPGTIIFKSRKI